MCCVSDKNLKYQKLFQDYSEHLMESEMQVKPVEVFCWESEYTQPDSQIVMPSYLPALMDKEFNFCKGIPFKMCIWINTFSLVGHNPDIPEGEADLPNFHFWDWVQKAKILSIEK